MTNRHTVIRDIHYLRGEIERAFGPHSTTMAVCGLLLAKAEAERKWLDAKDEAEAELADLGEFDQEEFVAAHAGGQVMDARALRKEI